MPRARNDILRLDVNPHPLAKRSMNISVIVPLYNKGSYIARALLSIRAQTHSDFEVIVVDDGSTDDGAEIVRQVEDPRIRLISQENRGPGAARNHGIALATGRLITFLDADDEWRPTFLEHHLTVLASHPDAASSSCGYIEYPAGRSLEGMWRRRGLEERVYSLTPGMPPQLAVHLLAYMSPCSTVIYADVLRRHGGYYDKTRCLYGEDAYLWQRVLLHETVAVTFAPLVIFHRDASDLSAQDRPRPIEPHLTDPEGLFAVCPPHLDHLLRSVLEIRALKTASMLAYWGMADEGRRLMNQFVDFHPWNARYIAAKIGTSRFGPTLAKLLRATTAARL
jgi:GT2 family glycosyltransferase